MPVEIIQRRPLKVQAVLYDGDNAAEILEFCEGNAEIHPVHGRPVIHTREGSMLITVGDRVVKGVKGEFYPLKPDVYAESYDRAYNFRGT